MADLTADQKALADEQKKADAGVALRMYDRNHALRNDFRKWVHAPEENPEEKNRLKASFMEKFNLAAGEVNYEKPEDIKRLLTAYQEEGLDKILKNDKAFGKLTLSIYEHESAQTPDAKLLEQQITLIKAWAKKVELPPLTEEEVNGWLKATKSSGPKLNFPRQLPNEITWTDEQKKTAEAVRTDPDLTKLDAELREVLRTKKGDDSHIRAEWDLLFIKKMEAARLNMRASLWERDEMKSEWDAKQRIEELPKRWNAEEIGIANGLLNVENLENKKLLFVYKNRFGNPEDPGQERHRTYDKLFDTVIKPKLTDPDRIEEIKSWWEAQQDIKTIEEGRKSREAGKNDQGQLAVPDKNAKIAGLVDKSFQSLPWKSVEPSGEQALPSALRVAKASVANGKPTTQVS